MKNVIVKIQKVDQMTGQQIAHKLKAVVVSNDGSILKVELEGENQILNLFHDSLDDNFSWGIGGEVEILFSCDPK